MQITSDHKCKVANNFAFDNKSKFQAMDQNIKSGTTDIQNHVGAAWCITVCLAVSLTSIQYMLAEITNVTIKNVSRYWKMSLWRANHSTGKHFYKDNLSLRILRQEYPYFFKLMNQRVLTIWQLFKNLNTALLYGLPILVLELCYKVFNTCH